MRRIAILAAEPSGDFQGAALARALKERIPDVELFGYGCSRMRAEGVRLLADTSVWGTIGPSEAIPKIFKIWLCFWRTRWELWRNKPEVTIMIDSPAIHMRMARFTRALGLTSVYYFPPSAWSNNPKRFQQIAGRTDAVVATFELNYKNYCSHNIPVAYYGHPMVDQFEPLPAEQAQQKLGLEAGAYVALLPGSRTQEIRLLTPILMEAARQMREKRPELEFLLPAASPQVETQLRGLLGEPPPWLHIFSGQSREVMASSQVVLMTSGSASLEAALLGIPMVIFYKFNQFDYNLARLLTWLGLFKARRFALPNLVLDEDLVSQHFQDEVTPERLATEGLELLEGPARSRQQQVLGRVRDSLGRSPVIPKIAALVDYLGRGRALTESLEAVEQEQWTSF